MFQWVFCVLKRRLSPSTPRQPAVGSTPEASSTVGLCSTTTNTTVVDNFYDKEKALLKQRAACVTRQDNF